jgi:hypothetical protein
MADKQQTDRSYEPTPREARTLAAHKLRGDRQNPMQNIKIQSVEDSCTKVRVDHKDMITGNILLMESLATVDPDFFNGLICQVVNLSDQGGKPNEQGTNFILSMIKGIEPKDQLETMLAAQMAAIHNATMTFALRLKSVKTIAQQDSAERALNKLARTFTSQIEALKRYRSTGEQKVTVQHVTVNEGGQAVIGQVTTGAGRNENEDLPHAPKPLTYAESETLPRALEAVRETVPSTRR